MTLQMRAVYRKGTFVVQETCDLPEESEVDLIIAGPVMRSPVITDPVERARVLAKVTQRMQQNPLPPNAPRFTRDELHERG